MAYDIQGFTVGVIPANSDLSAKQFYAVNVIPATGSNQGTAGAGVGSPSASGDAILGVLQNNPLLGEAAEVMVHGVSKAVIQGSVTVGQLLMSVPGGKLAVATSGKYAVAQALEAGSDSTIVTVLLIRNGLVA